MQRMKNENFGQHFFSGHLQKKMRLFAVSKAAIIEAPSGYGKTTAMRGYLKDAVKDGEDVFWFTAIEEEAPAVLYRRFCYDLGKIDTNAGERLLEIDFPNAFTIGEVCDTLRNIKCDRKTLLVIDDFQFLFAILPPSFLTALLSNDTEELCVIVLTQMLGQDFHTKITGLGIPYITASDLQWSAEDILCYFRLSGENISKAEACEVERITDGWIIAVHLQLCSYYETGAFSNDAVLQMMEHVIWDKMSKQQQEFLMRASVFESCSLKRLCDLLGFDTLPDYAKDSIKVPFIRYVADQKLCVPHTLLRELVCIKRDEQGEQFVNECFLRAGDTCRVDGEFAEAVYFYAQIKDYESILSLDLSHLVCAETGSRFFNDIALEIAHNCALEVKQKYQHSMLCVAWAVRFLENEDEFKKLMDELDGYIPKSGLLRAEWLLLSVYLHYPNLEEMLPIVREASDLFGETCSSVILPEVPWAFYEYLQLATFHIKAGAAHEEAALFEHFITTYSRLTGGHGAGADVLFRAELAFFKCETAEAEILAFKAVFLSESKQQKNIQIGAMRLLAVIALLKSDFTGWQRVVNEVELVSFGSKQNTSMFRLMLDVVHSSLMAQLREYERIADWLKDTGFLTKQLPAAILLKAVEIHGYYLMGKGEYAQLVGFLQTVQLEKYTPFPEHFHFFTIAVGYSSLGNTTEAIKYIEHSAGSALPDDMLHCFVGFSRLLGGLSDEFIESSYPDYLARFKEYKERYYTGWFKLYRSLVKNELPGALTQREREIAMLAADGLRNNEIAERLFVSEHTIRAHLRSIYQKLDIDRRAKLAKVLK